MKHELYELYQQCFPNKKVSRESFLEKLDYDHSDVIIEQENSKIAGALVLNENTVMLLCVAPWARCKGYGKMLLQSAETMVLGREYDQIILGHGKTYLFPGVPYGEKKEYQFFEKLGYRADWTSVDMEINLASYHQESLSLRDLPDNIKFCILSEERKEELYEAVASVKESWLRYFKTTKCPVAAAVRQNRIVGFEILSKQVMDNQVVGYVGCVGVIPEERNQGIGLAMVSYGLEQLKKEDVSKVVIEYTDKEDWYSKLGAVTVQRYWMGQKQLQQNK